MHSSTVIISALLFCCFISLTSLQRVTESCHECVYPIWIDAIMLEGRELCRKRSMHDVWRCFDNCIIQPSNKPESYVLHVMTQFVDIFRQLASYRCMYRECRVLAACMEQFAYYPNETFGPFETVFNYQCEPEALANTTECIMNANCDHSRRMRFLTQELMPLAYQAACNTSRRCITHGNIYEVYPGSNCTRYLLENLVYGPSTGKTNGLDSGVGFNTYVCKPDWLSDFECPADPSYRPVMSEALPQKKADPVVSIGEISVDTSKNCALCLHPLWEWVVTNNGSHVCESRVQTLLFRCLDNCGNGEIDVPQRTVDALVKVADIHKALDLNRCENNICSWRAFSCFEKIVSFYPMSAPHVTVNHFNCSEGAMDALKSCFWDSCYDGVPKTMLPMILQGYDGICNSTMRCMTFGNIYELVPVDHLNAGQDRVPCAYYRAAPANGWQRFNSTINRVVPGLVFNTDICMPDWPQNFECPPNITGWFDTTTTPTTAPTTPTAIPTEPTTIPTLTTVPTPGTETAPPLTTPVIN